MCHRNNIYGINISSSNVYFPVSTIRDQKQDDPVFIKSVMRIDNDEAGHSAEDVRHSMEHSTEVVRHPLEHSVWHSDSINLVNIIICTLLKLQGD